jgi:hypothetical protein
MSQRHGAAAQDRPDRERAVRFDHRRDRQDLAEQQLLVAGQVRHGHLDQEVVGAGYQVAGDDRRDFEQLPLDAGRGRLRVALNPQANEDGEGQPGAQPADLGAICGAPIVCLIGAGYVTRLAGAAVRPRQRSRGCCSSW